MTLVFLALDWAGSIHGVALVEEAAGVGPDSPGWLVRSRLLAGCWMIDRNAETLEPHSIAGRIAEAGEHWGVSPADSTLVLVSRDGREWILEVAAVLGCRKVYVAGATHAISPRGLAPAVAVKVYHAAYRFGGGVHPRVLRESFVSMMENAADDVQADGLEQDDTFLDRFAEVREITGGRTVVVPVESLTDDEWLAETWQETFRSWWGVMPQSGQLEVISLHLRCAVGTPDHGFRAGAVADKPPVVQIPSGWASEQTRMGHLLCRASCGSGIAPSS